MNPIFLTLALTLASMCGITTARISLSLTALDLGAQPAEVGLLMGSQFIFPLLVSWPIGRLVDRIGSRLPMMIGLACGAAGMSLPWAFPNLYALYAAGILIGVAFAFIGLVVINMMGLLSTPADRARNFANNALMGSAANIVGPLVAGFAIDHAGHGVASLSASAMFLGALVLLAIWGGIWPRGRGKSEHHARSSQGQRLLDRQSIDVMMVSVLVQMANDLFALYVPIYGHSIGLSASVIGSVMASGFAAVCIIRLMLQWLVRRYGETRVMSVAQYGAAATFALIPLFQGPLMLGVVCFAFGLGLGCTQPLVMSLLFSRAPPGRSGELVALRQTANNVIRVAGPPGFGVLAGLTGIASVFVVSGALMAVGGWLAGKNDVGKAGTAPLPPSSH